MAIDLSPIHRYELKYTVTEELAAEIRQFIQPLFTLDANLPAEQAHYTVNSVYMDTPGLRFYNDTRLRQLLRFKPRVRYYGTGQAGAATLEVKYRHSRTVWKVRERIATSEWPGVLQVAREDRTSPRHETMPRSFVDLHHLYGTEPVLHVRYEREPYVSEVDAYGRITFDRAMRYRLMSGSYDLWSRDEEMSYYDDEVTAQWAGSPVVVEIKTESLVPFWALDLVKRFSLVQRGYSKYRYVIDSCLERIGRGNDVAV